MTKRLSKAQAAFLEEQEVIRTSRRPSSSPISRTRSRSVTGPVSAGRHSQGKTRPGAPGLPRR